MKVLKEVLREIKPKKGELKKEVNSMISKINKSLRNAKAVVGGSFAKDTFLRGDHDCDIFVKFNYKYKDEDISKLLGKALKKFKPTTIPGSRNYYQIKNEINYEIVPVLDIKNPKKAVNVTDASPLHSAWVKKSKKSDEIRLAKAFCKAASVYGAESYIKGFSGHVLDILTINYGSFLKLLRAAVKWKQKQVIDVMKYHKNALMELNKSKLQSPIIVIDPIQPERNAAAALSYEKYEKFRTAAKNFLKNPSKSFFIKHKLTIDEIKKKAKGKELIIADVKALKGKEDIVGAKLLKSFEYLKRNLIKNEFKLINSGWAWNKKAKAIFWFILDKKILPETVIRAGPPLSNKKHAANFKKKHKKTFTKGKKLYAKVKRGYRKPKDLIKYLIKGNYIKERTKNVAV
jgi:tRNA nucleotidyltransferase (CCA-adding enzyme)